MKNGCSTGFEGSKFWKGVEPVAQSKWRRRGLALLAVLALAPVVPGLLLAEAHSFTAGSHVSIHYSQAHHRFHGGVTSHRPICESGRTVDVFRRRPGPDRLIGSDITGAQGHWRVHRAHPHGLFYAKVLRSSSGGYGHSHVCLRDRSTTIAVGVGD